MTYDTNETTKKLISIAVIPAHNESQFISKIVKDTKKYVNDVIVVDDGSFDETMKIANECGAIVYRNNKRLGKWAALNKGISLALKRNADIVVTLDGDGQHIPDEIPNFLHLFSNGTDVVLGVRAFNDKMPTIRKISNYITTFVINSLFTINVSDSQCGYRAYSRRALRSLTSLSPGFEGETESLIRLARNGLNIKEVPIKTVYGCEKSKVNALKDTWRFAKTVIRLKLRAYRNSNFSHF